MALPTLHFQLSNVNKQLSEKKAQRGSKLTSKETARDYEMGRPAGAMERINRAGVFMRMAEKVVVFAFFRCRGNTACAPGRSSNLT